MALDSLWLIQMFFADTVHVPYMAIRLNREKDSPAQSTADCSLVRARGGRANYVGLKEMR